MPRDDQANRGSPNEKHARSEADSFLLIPFMVHIKLFDSKYDSCVHKFMNKPL